MMEQIGRYKIVNEISRGSYGVVYRGHDPRLDRPVAIKVLLDLPSQTAAELRELYDNERVALGAVSHPNVLMAYDAGEDGGRLFIVTELLEGLNLADYLQQQRSMNVNDSCRTAAAIADGLAALHAKKLIHCDIKPSNVFLTTSGEVKILDVGWALLRQGHRLSIAKQRATLRPEEEIPPLPRLARDWIVGTPGYMPPEQWLGMNLVTPASDVFALGAVLVEMLTGTAAFSTARLDYGFQTPLLDMSVPDRIRVLTYRCIAGEAAARPTATQVAEMLRIHDVPIHPDTAVSSNQIEILPTRKTQLRDPVEHALRASIRPLLHNKRNFNDFYVPLAATTTTHLRDVPWPSDFDPSDPSPGAVEDDIIVPLKDAREALDLHSQFYLVGDPGGGKTLTLAAFEITAAQRFLDNLNAPFPLAIDVSSWFPNEQPFIALIENELESKIGRSPFPPERLLLLVDGAVDAAEPRPDDPLQRIEEWLKAHPRCAAVLAVRLRAPLMGSLPVVRIQPLDDERVTAFVMKRLGNTEGAVLLDQIGWGRTDQKERDVRGLMRNPFNLTLLCRMQLEGSPPATQGDLIRRVVEEKHKRESKANVGKVDLRTFLDTLGSVAVLMIRNRANLAADIGSFLTGLSDPRDLHELLSLGGGCGVIQERRRNKTYEFTHRLYLEYLAAEYLRTHVDVLREVLTVPRYELGQRVPQRFDEVIHTLVDLDGSGKMIETIVARDPFLGALCLPLIPADSDDRPRSDLAVVNGLVGLLQTSNFGARESAAAALAEIGSPAIASLNRALADQKHWVRRTAVRTLARIPHVDAVEAVVKALIDSNRWVRGDAEAAVRRFSERFRDILVQLIRNPRWIAQNHDRRIDERLAELTVDTDQRLAEAIFTTTGIRTESMRPEVEKAPVETPKVTPKKKSTAPKPTRVSWGLKWIAAWHADPGNSELLTEGLAWIRGASNRDSGWSMVWTALWRAVPNNPELEWLARDWLDSASNKHGAWGYIWPCLWATAPGDAELERIGRRWLRQTQPTHAGWWYVWKGLSGAYPADAELQALRREWLTAMPTSNAFWEKVRTERDPEAIEWATSWLREVGSHPKWAFAFDLLWLHGGDRAILASIGRDWLVNVGYKKGEFTRVWEPLWIADPSNRELFRLGLDWLGNFIHHPAWSHIWEKLWNTSPNDAPLIDIVIKYLSEGRENVGWGFMWRALVDAGNQDERLIGAGREWLNTHPDGAKGWSRVWSYFVVHGPDEPSLLNRGWTWMEPNYYKRNSWPQVWETLWNADVEQHLRLGTLAIDWLAVNEDRMSKIARWEEILKLPDLPHDGLLTLRALLNRSRGEE